MLLLTCAQSAALARLEAGLAVLRSASARTAQPLRSAGRDLALPLLVAPPVPELAACLDGAMVLGSPECPSTARVVPTSTRRLPGAASTCLGAMARRRPGSAPQGCAAPPPRPRVPPRRTGALVAVGGAA